jgi:hypothetical protein
VREEFRGGASLSVPLQQLVLRAGSGSTWACSRDGSGSGNQLLIQVRFMFIILLVCEYLLSALI